MIAAMDSVRCLVERVMTDEFFLANIPVLRDKEEYKDQYRYEYTIQEYGIQLLHPNSTKGPKKNKN